MRRSLSATFIALSLLFPVSLSAMTLQPRLGSSLPEQISAETLPRIFKGIFSWRGPANPPQYVTLMLRRVHEAAGLMVFGGTNVYTHPYPGSEHIQVRGKIDVKTLKVSIFENNKPDASFVNEGSYEGTISTDGGTLTLVWTTAGTGEKGDLKMQAVLHHR